MRCCKATIKVSGSDSVSSETIVGMDEITREEIANVLEELISRRIIDEQIGLDFLSFLQSLIKAVYLAFCVDNALFTGKEGVTRVTRVT